MEGLKCGKELTVQTLLLLQSSLCLQKEKTETNPKQEMFEKEPVGQEGVVQVALGVLAEVADVAQLLQQSSDDYLTFLFLEEVCNLYT